jgi:hypothetical protein
MRLLCILSAVVFLISITGCQTGPSETDKQIVKNLKEVNQKLVAINKQLKEIKEEVEDADTPLPMSQPYHAQKGPDLRRLKKIKLAKNPTKEQVEEYINKIINTSRGQNRFSPNDPQIAMLSKVGSENIDLLLRYAQNYYAQTVIPNLATKKDKKKILEALKIYPNLITCIVKNDWGKDAREIIFERLKYNTTGYLHHQWITVAVQLASPKEYAVLEKYFIRGRNPQMTYNALNQLEGFDMKRAVAKAWEYQKRGAQPWQKKQIAAIAAKFGHKDALKYLIRAYRTETNQHWAGQIRASLYQLTGETFPPKKMAKWYKENEAKLVFDPENEGYIIKGEVRKSSAKIPVPKINKGPNFSLLRKIKLPKNPTKKQAEEYIKKIVAASKGQKHFSGNDPQIAMLCKVGSKNIDLLIDNVKDNHVCWALKRVVTRKDKKQILEAFKKSPGLIGCITKYGWAGEAKTSIFKYIKNGPADPSPQLWIAAVVKLASPKEYGILEDYFVRAGNPEMIFNTLSQLDGFDIKKAVAKGWAKKKLQSSTYSKGNMAIIAAKYGHKDALKYMVYAKEKNQYLAREMRATLYQLTGETFSPIKMEKWYKENEAKLVFDPENEEYIIK